MRKYVCYIVLMALLCTTTACHRTRPQRPSNKPVEEVDSATLALVYARQRLVSEADKALIEVVKDDTLGGFVQERGGYWWRRDKGHRTQDIGHETQEKLREGEKVDIHWVIEPTQDIGHKTKYFVVNEEMLIEIGKSEVPMAVKFMLREMCHGEQVEMLVPWYAGFGAEGNGCIGPYQNIRIMLTVE